MNWISGKSPELVFFDASGAEALRENVEKKTPEELRTKLADAGFKPSPRQTDL